MSFTNLNRRGAHPKISTEWAHGLRQAVAKPLTLSNWSSSSLVLRTQWILCKLLILDFYFEGILSKFFKSLKYESDIHIKKQNVIKSGERMFYPINTGHNQGDKVFPKNQQRQCWLSIFWLDYLHYCQVVAYTPPPTHTLTHKHIAVCLSSFIRFKLRYQAEIKVKANKNGERHLWF